MKAPLLKVMLLRLFERVLLNAKLTRIFLKGACSKIKVPSYVMKAVISNEKLKTQHYPPIIV